MTGAEIGVALSKLGISLIRKVFNPPTANVLPIKKFTDNMTMKVVFVGPDRSGTKTSLINRYVSGSFAEAPTPQKRSTVATEIKKIQVNGLTVNLSLTDAPGSERSVAPYLKTAIAAVVGYDITSKDSFSGCMKLCESIRTKYPSVFIMVVGGMSDKASNKSVPSEEAKARSKEAGAKLFFEG